jgi:hypothetical protein
MNGMSVLCFVSCVILITVALREQKQNVEKDDGLVQCRLLTGFFVFVKEIRHGS